MLEDIHNELHRTHPADLLVIKNYAAWLRLRRHVHHSFYFQAHWVKPTFQAHWV